MCLLWVIIFIFPSVIKTYPKSNWLKVRYQDESWNMFSNPCNPSRLSVENKGGCGIGDFLVLQLSVHRRPYPSRTYGVRRRGSKLAHPPFPAWVLPLLPILTPRVLCYSGSLWSVHFALPDIFWSSSVVYRFARSVVYGLVGCLAAWLLGWLVGSFFSSLVRSSPKIFAFLRTN